MDRIISKLLLYGDMPFDCILMQLGDICKNTREQTQSKDELVTRLFQQVKKILKVATNYGFDHNLWHNYLTFFLINNENPFSLICEKVGAREGSVNFFAKSDFKVFQALFRYDFTWLEQSLGVDCFSRLFNYTSIVKSERMYNKNVSTKVQALSLNLNQAADENEFFTKVTGFYRDFGVGMFGLNKAFRISSFSDGEIVFHAINNMDQVMLDDLVGYELQKKKLINNTKAFVKGRKANNCLLFGDSGTGKSTSIKAIVNEFYPQGLRIIEIYKHQFKDLFGVITKIKNRNYKFIIYMDDLSFEEFEIEYKFLKAVIEGGVETNPDNVLIYATSNRRHLLRETWKDREDMENDEEIHRSDTIEEKLALVNRFGVTINFPKPNQREYFYIVTELAKKAKITISEKELKLEANQWELSHGGISGRTAQQFITYLQGMKE
ncbi:MAG: ATP-binding protein [Lachnospiraceae bacterium]|nr:ATP-binding protein [Lachnospiraceae bacterium]